VGGVGDAPLIAPAIPKDIHAAARMTISHYGSDAAEQAWKRCSEAKRRRSSDGVLAWAQVAATIVVMQRQGERWTSRTRMPRREG
jgi:hypothetical protein